MTDTALFITGLGLTLTVCIAVVGFLRKSLRNLLLDICGSEDRAAFWTAFSIVMLLLVSAVFAMHIHPQIGLGEAALIAMSKQVEWGLIGLACTIATIGLVISFFISPGDGRTIRSG